MNAHVKILRCDGERKSERDIHSDPGTHGVMTLAQVGKRIELKLAALNDSQMKPIVPVLQHTRLVTMHGNRMLFQGLTAPREDGELPQEWAVEVST